MNSYSVSYKKLWKLMIDRGLKKGQLRIATGMSKGTLAKLGKDEIVSLNVLLSVCEYLGCDFCDIMEVAPASQQEVPYYMAYELRYQKLLAAGAPCWADMSNDEILTNALSRWVIENNLKGKRIIEYACGEGVCGTILTKLGCRYHGVDVAPSAVKRAAAALREYPAATVSLLDMVEERVNDEYDAALDVMGLQMLVADRDRRKYLENVMASLKAGAHALFFRESFREDAYDGVIQSFHDWKKRNNDLIDLQQIPVRAKSKAGYMAELEAVGFDVDDFVCMDINMQQSYSASIYVHKPGRLF